VDRQYYGLNRYDGHDIVVYQYDSADSSSLANNLVWTIFEDHEKNLLIGTSGGLCQYKWEKNQFINYMNEFSSPLHFFNYNVF